jgi:hypothetical protein
MLVSAMHDSVRKRLHTNKLTWHMAGKMYGNISAYRHAAMLISLPGMHAQLEVSFVATLPCRAAAATH